ncbi:MAG: glycosyltransferase family 25 protein [Notoacmeibacter sp.]|nr:glycosyltransferase family 25 protein [Notoacmeibacter sp.]
MAREKRDAAEAPIPCYLINLDRSADRLRSFAAQAAEIGIAFERVAAVDGGKIGADDQEKLIARVCGKLPVGPGEMACFLSHREVWAKIRSGTAEWAFVAEDDIRFSGDAGTLFQDSGWIPKDADIVKAETARQWVHMDSRLHSQVGGHAVRRLHSYHGGSAGYFVSKGTAEKLLELTETKCDPLDHVLFHKWVGVVQHLVIYQLDPAICIQDYLVETSAQRAGFKSTLDNDRKESRRQFRPANSKPLHKVWREISRPFRRLAIRAGYFLENWSGRAVVKRVPIDNLVARANS